MYLYKNLKVNAPLFFTIAFSIASYMLCVITSPRLFILGLSL